MEKDTGYASAGLGSNHPEVLRREMEISTTPLTQEEFLEAIKDGQRKKWHRLNSATIDFKPESKGEENK